MNVRLTKIAENDLANIKINVYEVSKDENTAYKIVSDIIKSFERLKDFPESGARYEDNNGNLLYRYVKSGNYYSFYKCSKRTVDIYIEFYMRRETLKIYLSKYKASITLKLWYLFF